VILTQNNGTGVSGYSRLEAAENVVYLTIQDSNEKWAGRKLRGFAEAHEAPPANV
jgi:putative transposase